MKIFNALQNRTGRNFLVTTFAAALAVASMFGLVRPAQADDITVPPVPANLNVDAGNQVFLVGHARGTQNYICLPSGSGFAFKLFTPEATLFDDEGEQIITHFFSPIPGDNSTIRATWMDSRDTSTVWAQTAPNGSSTDPKFVKKGAIAWLLLNVVASQKGPTGGDTLFGTKQIQRLNTVGGLAPATGCASSTDIGRQAFVPYRADYFFYR